MKLNTKRCQELMNEQCVSLKDIERMTGITVSSLSWIFENRYLEVSTLERIADALKCGANDIASFDDYNGENVIEFLKDGKVATVTFSQGRYKTRIKKLAQKFPEECQIVAENQDGTMRAHIPVAWVRINPTMVLTDEQKEERTNRLLGK